MDFPGAQMVNNLPVMQETWVSSLGWEDSLEEGMATHCSIFAQGQRSLVGYNSWGHKESDMTEQFRTHTHDMFTWTIYFSVSVELPPHQVSVLLPCYYFN